MGWGEARGPSDHGEKSGPDALPPEVLEAISSKEKFRSNLRNAIRLNVALTAVFLIVIGLDIFILAALPWSPRQIITLISLAVLIAMALSSAYHHGVLVELGKSVDRWDESMDEMYMEVQAAWIKWMKEQ